MVMATVTPVTVLAPPVLSRGHIVNVITVNVKRATFIVKDMAMVVAMVSVILLSTISLNLKFNFRQEILLW